MRASHKSRLRYRAVKKASSCTGDYSMSRTIVKVYKSDESLLGNCRSITELTIFVGSRCPNTAIFFEHHTVESACSNGRRPTRDHTNETVTRLRQFVSELATIVISCYPHTAILLKHHTVSTACSNSLCPTRHHLDIIHSIDCRFIPQLTVLVPTCCPDTTIIL